LTDVLTRDGWTSTDEKTIEALTVLQEAITAFLRKTKKSRAV
jgi:hypothetical protein